MSDAELHAEIRRLTAERDQAHRTWREDVAELAEQAGELRVLIAEILARFEPHCDDPDCTGAVIEADTAEISRWRERAGLEN